MFAHVNVGDQIMTDAPVPVFKQLAHDALTKVEGFLNQNGTTICVSTCVFLFLSAINALLTRGSVQEDDTRKKSVVSLPTSWS